MCDTLLKITIIERDQSDFNMILSDVPTFQLEAKTIQYCIPFAPDMFKAIIFGLSLT